MNIFSLFVISVAIWTLREQDACVFFPFADPTHIHPIGRRLTDWLISIDTDPSILAIEWETLRIYVVLSWGLHILELVRLSINWCNFKIIIWVSTGFLESGTNSSFWYCFPLRASSTSCIMHIVYCNMYIHFIFCWERKLTNRLLNFGALAH